MKIEEKINEQREALKWVKKRPKLKENSMKLLNFMKRIYK